MNNKKYICFFFVLLVGVLMLNPLSVHAAENNTAKDNAVFVGNKAQITTLKNGLKVYVLADTRFPLVSTRLYVRAGSAYEEPKEAGISHVLEHMVFKGTEKRPKGAIATEVEAVGGYLNAATSFDYTVYLTDMPSEHWKLGMDVVKDMAFHASLDAKELESEKEVVLSELQRGNDNPGQRIFKALHGETLKNTPYEHPIIGYEETIKAITTQDMRDYIAKYYQPQNMLLVVVGNVEPKAVLDEAQKLFGSLQNTSNLHPVEPLQADLLRTHGVEVTRGPWNKVYIGMALPVPGFMDVQGASLDVLAHVLGGDSTSYLYKKYKYDKQLVDAISVGNYSFQRVGMLYFNVQLDAHNLEAFWKEFVADIASLKASEFSAKDIARAQLQMEDGIHRAKETLAGLASWKGYLELFMGGEQGEKNILSTVHQVTQKNLQEDLDTWLVPERFNVVVLAPQQATLPDLTASLQAAWPVTEKALTASTDLQSVTPSVIDLGEGRKVVLIPDATLPYTAVDFYMSGGDSLLSSKEQGLATLTAHVLTTGTKSMTAPQIEEFLAERAASLSSFSGRQSFGFSMRQPKRFNADVLHLFKDILTEPSVVAAEVDREKTSQISAIRSRNDQPLGYAFSKMPPFLFGEGHPYSFNSLGDVEQVEAFTPTMIKDFWKKQERQPWVLSIAGDFDKDAMLAFAKSLPKPQDTSKKITAPTWSKTDTLDLHMPGRDQAHLMLVFKTVPPTHKDAVGLELLQTALAGQSGLLFRELRDKQGLGYTVTAVSRFMPEAGYMLFYIGTEPDKLAQAEKGFVDVITHLHKDLLPNAEIQRAKNQMQGDYYRERQSLGSRSAEGGLRTLLGQNLDFRKERIAEAQTITAENLREIARQYLKLDDLYKVSVTP